MMRQTDKFSNLEYKQNIVRCNNGFKYALLCALFWGLSYYVISIIMRQSYTSLTELIEFSCFLAMGISLLNMTLGFFWVVVQNKLTELKRTLLTFSLCKLLVPAAILGGIAATATYIILGMINSVFSTVFVLFYPIIDTLIVRYWFKEKITLKCLIGLFIILFFSILFYLTNVIHAEGELKWGCLLGIIGGLGWALEGTLAARTMDFIDSDVSVTIRYCFESVFWCIMLVLCIFFQIPSLSLSKISHFYFQHHMLFLIPFSALLLTFNYINWYRSFLYIGVSRSSAVSDISGFAVLVLFISLERDMPDWYGTLMAIGSLIGVFIIYRDCMEGDGLPVLRSISTEPVDSALLESTGKSHNSKRELPTKTTILYLVLSKHSLWDYEIAELLEKEKEFKYERNRINYRNQIRQWTIEMRSAGLIHPIEETFDPGDKFSEGKRLCRYSVTNSGLKRFNKL